MRDEEGLEEFEERIDGISRGGHGTRCRRRKAVWMTTRYVDDHEVDCGRLMGELRHCSVQAEKLLKKHSALLVLQ